MNIATALAAALLLTGCSNLSGGAAGGKPQLADQYQRAFDRAWDAAGEGRSPTTACAGVIGVVVGTMKNAAPGTTAHSDALDAANACYVDAFVRYIALKLDGPAFAESDCVGLLTATHIHRSALGQFITDIGQDRADYDNRIVGAVGDKVRASCPAVATSILAEA